MLKIKDDVDLKELEKFGFKPNYDEDTGELKEYYKEYLTNLDGYRYSETIRFYIIKSTKLFSTKCICCGGTWDVFHDEFGYKIIDLIYDLIQANLVEKVGIKNG